MESATFLFNKEVEHIIMLKKENIYMFFIEDTEKNRLYLLSGGICMRMEITDIDYYYNNMVPFANYIKQELKEYNNTLKKISVMVKKIGGEGKIHGCIIDIDYYNHIYLNPQDGSIKAYYAENKSERDEYSSIEDLLENNLPKLFSNYKQLISSQKSPVVPYKINNSPAKIIHMIGTAQ